MLIDKNRISELFDLHFEDIYQFCFSFTQNVEDAEDIAQQTFTVMLKKSEMLEDSDLKSWLYHTAYYEVCKFLKQNQKNAKFAPHRIDRNIHEENLTSSFCLDAELDKLAYPDNIIEQYKEKVLSELSPGEQALYKAVFEENKSYKQIADELGITEKAVNVRSFRMREKIKSLAKTLISLIFITFYNIFM